MISYSKYLRNYLDDHPHPTQLFREAATLLFRIGFDPKYRRRVGAKRFGDLRKTGSICGIVLDDGRLFADMVSRLNAHPVYHKPSGELVELPNRAWFYNARYLCPKVQQLPALPERLFSN